MLQSRIIPVLLMRDKGLVKTRQFKEDKYVGDPINAVKIFNEKEVDELTLYDIDATVKGYAPDYDQLRKIAVESRMPLCYGGGITSAKQASEMIAIGFEKVSVSAAALARPELIKEMADRVGRQSVVVTVDVRKEGLISSYTVYSHNAQKKQGVRLLDFVAQAEALGAGEIVINSIDRDGMMQGYDLNLAKSIRKAVTVPLSFVGGAGNSQHMGDLIQAVGTVGAAAGSMFVFKGTYRAVLISYARPIIGEPPKS
jgi:imidazole glycerol-phosphate synthase subunit HisF